MLTGRSNVELQPLLRDTDASSPRERTAIGLIAARGDKLRQSTAAVEAQFQAGGGYAGHPGAITVEFRFIRLYYVDELSGSFKARINLTVRWYDADFAEHSGVNVAVTAKSCPVLFFANCTELPESAWDMSRMDSGFGEETAVVLRRMAADPPGVLFRSGFFTGVFSTDMDLHDFPYDAQCLPVVIRGWGAGVDRTSDFGRYLVPLAIYAVDGSRSDGSRALSHDEWTVFQPASRSVGQLREKQRLEVVLIVARKPSYYLRVIMLPLFGISNCTFLVFLLDPEALGDRLSLVFTMLLTVVAFKLVMADKLPRLTYTTHVDQYTDCCFWVIFAICLENSIAYIRATGWSSMFGINTFSDEGANWLGLACCAVFWLVCNLHVLFTYWCTARLIRQKLGAPLASPTTVPKWGSLGTQFDDLE